MPTANGTLEFTEAVVAGEQVLRTFELTERTRISSIWIDGSNTVSGWAARIYVMIDGTNYRYVPDHDIAVAAGESINLLINGPIEGSRTIQIRLLSAGIGGGVVDVPYSIPYGENLDNIPAWIQTILRYTGFICNWIREGNYRIVGTS